MAKNKSQTGNYQMDSGLVVRADSHVGIFTANYPPAPAPGEGSKGVTKKSAYKGKNLLRSFQDGGKK